MLRCDEILMEICKNSTKKRKFSGNLTNLSNSQLKFYQNLD